MHSKVQSLSPFGSRLGCTSANAFSPPFSSPILFIYSLMYTLADPTTFINNLGTPFPDVEIYGIIRDGGFFTALFFGYASAMLGVSGFESSSQFVQSQAPGVFVKTLRNMWLGCIIFNPLISFLALSVLPMSVIMEDEYTVSK